MAARGYWQAFQAVQESLEKILKGENPGEVADADHGRGIESCSRRASPSAC